MDTKTPDVGTTPPSVPNAYKNSPCRPPLWKILLEWLTFAAAVAAAIAAGIPSACGE